MMDASLIKNAVYNFIKQQKNLESTEFLKSDSPLIEGGSGILDSFDVVQLVSFLEEEFLISIIDDDISEENMNTIEDIAKYVLSKLAMDDGR